MGKVGDRIKAYLDFRDISQKELAQKSQLSESKLSKIINGSQQLREEEMIAIASALEISVDDLLGISNVRKLDTGDFVQVPIVGTIRAGNGRIAYEEIEGYSAFLQSDIKKDKDYVVLRVKGDSMTGDGIREGDTALIEKESEYEKNKIYAVIVNGEEAMLKHLVQEEDQLILYSSNPAYPPKLFHGKQMEEVIVIGKMVKLQRNM